MNRTALTTLLTLAPLTLGGSPATDGAETSAQPARLIRAEVRVGDKVVLRGTTSDDGSQDADEVWLAADQVKLLPTEHFAALKVPEKATKHRLVGTPIPPDGVTDHAPAHRDAVFWISVGGKVEGMTLEIERATVDLGKPAWKIPRRVLVDRFNWRLITRYEARKLKKIQRETSQPFERLIRAEVRIGDKVVLRGTISDDGSRDADEVWVAADEVKLLPTAHFAALKVPEKATKHLLVGTPIPPDGMTDHEPARRDAVFSIQAGGKVEGMTLEIERTTVGFGKPAWKIPSHVLVDRFNQRRITRYEARKLKKIQRKQ